MSKISFKNCKVHYKVSGKGPEVTLLHGFLENLNMWDTAVSVLEKTHTVLRIDLPGHGETGNPGYIHGMELQAEMVKAVLDHLSIKKTAFIGHSMGGYVALAFAEKYPDRVSGIMLLNSTALPDDAEKRLNRDRTIKAVKQLPETFIKMAIPNLFAGYNKEVFKNQIEKLTNEALKTSHQGIIAALEGMKIRKDRSFILREAKFPVAMIIGKNDPALDYDSLYEQVKDTRVKTYEFPDGHMSFIENEKDVLKILKEFADSCPQD